MEPVENTSAARHGTGGLPHRQRSAVTNGRRLFVEADARSAWSRRYRDLIAAHSADLGGVSILSEAQRSLVRRCSALELELESMEGKLSQSEPVDMDIYARLTGHLRRVLETLGIERRARDVTLDGVEVEVFSPMRARWAEAEAAEAAKREATE
jgi:hypothetical protein